MINKAEIEQRMLMGPGPSDVHPRRSGGDGHAAPRVLGQSVL
jgi:hypothetical protein